MHETQKMPVIILFKYFLRVQLYSTFYAYLSKVDYNGYSVWSDSISPHSIQLVLLHYYVHYMHPFKNKKKILKTLRQLAQAFVGNNVNDKLCFI